MSFGLQQKRLAAVAAALPAPASAAVAAVTDQQHEALLQLV